MSHDSASVSRYLPVFLTAFILAGSPLAAAVGGETADEEIVIEDDAGGDATGDEMVIEEDAGGEAAGDEMVIEESTGGEPAGNGGDAAIEIGDDDEGLQPLLEEPVEEAPMETATAAAATPEETRAVTLKVDRLWAEYGYFTESSSLADQQGYLHGRATLQWNISSAWEAQLSLRADGYYQSGELDSTTTKLDYDESFIRFKGQSTRVTLGAEKVIWGRIDEIPPTDRLSTVDMSRFILDDLEDRRRASPVIRLEQFFADAKLDLVFLPWFREAQLPTIDSVWYPVRQPQGEIMGLKSSPMMTELIRNGQFTTEAPDTDGGFGARYTASAAGFDYGLTVQRTRQSTPYFRYDPTTNVFEAQYPRSWVLGGDFAREAFGATWRLEGAWFSDTPITEVGGTYDTVNSVSWGGGVEFFPGDGDIRVNLQVTGMNMIDAPQVVDRTDIYSFNGSFDIPFSHEKWNASMRFYVGLGENDVYLNPQLTYVGWEPFEMYLQAHYFQGGDGTPGGFHQDDSLLTLGWRARF